MSKAIKIPTSVTADTVSSVFAARERMSYTDKELGEAIALYDLVEKFMRASCMCSSTLYSVRKELESLEGFKSCRERN